MNPQSVFTLNEYQRAALRTKNEVSYREQLSLCALGIAGEGGEVADHIKKHLYHGHQLDFDKVKKELGDLMWYISVMANHLDMTLQDVAQTNVTKLEKRYPEGFSEQASINRSE